MKDTAAGQLSVGVGPGTTASGIASASQLVDFTPSTTWRVDMTASPRKLAVLVPPQIEAFDKMVTIPARTPLAAEEYPVLAEILDNEEDDIFDTI